jgi:ubiquitin carboxyl-terminal hydrolase 5/13
LFAIPEWQKRYTTSFAKHSHECAVPYEGEGKGSCLECQIAKVCDGLLSGRYSIKQGISSLFKVNIVTVHPDGAREEYQSGIAPRMLKHLIGAGHPEFAGMKQQDAQEFLMWLLSRIQRKGKATGQVETLLTKEEANKSGWGGYVDPTRCFRFVIQQRIQCLGCGGVKYRLDEVDNLNITIPYRTKPYFPFNSI